MTGNQIAFNAHLENARHNKVTEEENKRHNLAYEYETGRHNRETELWQRNSLIETTRANKAREYLQKYATDMSYQSSLVQASATRYAASMNYAAAKYSADSSYKASLYATNQNALNTAKNNLAKMSIADKDREARIGIANADRYDRTALGYYTADKQYGASIAGTAGRIIGSVVGLLK